MPKHIQPPHRHTPALGDFGGDPEGEADALASEGSGGVMDHENARMPAGAHRIQHVAACNTAQKPHQPVRICPLHHDPKSWGGCTAECTCQHPAPPRMHLPRAFAEPILPPRCALVLALNDTRATR